MPSHAASKSAEENYSRIEMEFNFMTRPNSSRDIDNRRGPRMKAQREARLVASVSLFSEEDEASDLEQSVELAGYTHDLSESGLALIVPSFQCGEYMLHEEKSLKINIDLPTAPITVHAVPVRCVPLDAKEPEGGSLLGLRITKIDADDSERYKKYVLMSH